MSKDTLMRVAVLDRAAIIIGGKHLLHVDKNGRARGKNELWPFGGASELSDKEISELSSDTYQGRDFEVDDDGTIDLRFVLPANNRKVFEKWLKNRQASNKNIVKEMMEEAGEYYVPLELFKALKFSSSPNRNRKPEWRYDWSYLTKPHKPVWSLCFDRIYVPTVPKRVADRLKEIAADPDSWLDLVTPAEIRKGRSAKGNDIPRGCRVVL